MEALFILVVIVAALFGALYIAYWTVCLILWPFEALQDWINRRRERRAR